MSGYSYNLCASCKSPGSQRPPSDLPPLKDVVERYGRAAQSVNQREFNRLVKFIRERWDPLPPAEEEWLDDETHTDRYRGWTEEGAFAMCVYKHAFYPGGYEPERQGPLCEAEEKDQVYFRPIESFVDEFPKPFSDSRPTDEISEHLEKLRNDLQLQLDEYAPSSKHRVDIPQDFADLMHLTDGVKGAGVPSLTNGLDLVFPLKYHVAKPHARGWRTGYITPYAAWKFGDCSEEFQVIHYVLCRTSSRNDDSPLVWKVVDDRGPGDMDVYDDLSQFLQHETDHVEVVPGGHQMKVIMRETDRYPDVCSI